MADTFLVIGTGPTVNLVLSGVGASAYAIWLEAGNVGTEQDFLDSLVGATGPTGAAGATGSQGPIGPLGAAGATGWPGPLGIAGSAGATGATGPPGPAGATGATGPQGPIGLTGPTGAAGATGSQGPIGLTGPAGATGATGPQGDPGFVSLNGLTNPTQTFATDTTGTDFAISSSGTAHTFNLPSSSASNRGLLLAMDWTTFNNKVGGSGTSGYLSKFSGASTLSNSLVYDTGTNLGVNTTTPDKALTFKSTSLPLKGFSLDENGMYLARQTDGGYVSFISLDATSSVSDLYWQIEAARTVWRRGGSSMAWMAASSFAYPTIDGYFSVNNILSKYIKSWGNEGVIYSADQNNDVANVGHKVIQGTRPGSSTAGIMGWFYDTTERARLTTAGNFGLNTTTPTSNIDINGANGYSQLRLRTTYTPTSTADALGSTGDTSWDENYFYIKTAAGWKRSALSTF